MQLRVDNRSQRSEHLVNCYHAVIKIPSKPI
jgi:hypothetical protein